MAARPSKTLNPATFVVIGDGLSAGASDFGMSEERQPFSFPALAAAKMGVRFTQPIMEAPGIGPVIGFPDLPVRLPQPMQTTVLKEFPPAGPFSNVSIPGLKAADALTLRPVPPLIHRTSGLQTAVNLVLGLPGLMMGGQPLPTAVEYAAFLQPTLALVALGYFDVLDAAFKADAAAAPDAATFRAAYETVLTSFVGAKTTVITCTIPDPADTAYFTPVSAAARVLKAEPEVVCMAFGLAPSDCLTPTGLFEAGCRLITRTPGPLPPGLVVPAEVVARISERASALNSEIRALSDLHGALVFDLHGLTASLKRKGAVVGHRQLSADYLGGIYSLNGVYPGAVGHGLIANALLDLLNAVFGTGFGAVDFDALAKIDPVVGYQAAPGPTVTPADLAAMAAAPPKPAAAKRTRAAAAPPPAAKPSRAGTRITLPESLEATVPINKEASYFGDALRAAHATLEADIPFGSSPNMLFGGLCMTQSHVTGSLTFRFTPPDGDMTHFTMSVGEGLAGDDGVLVAPQLYRLPSIMNKVTDIPGMVSTGDLDLATGEVSNVRLFFAFMNSALLALVSVNPKIPPTPIEFSNDTRQDPSNPHYGSTWAKFSQRADGTLDFQMSGISFLPLGAGFGGDVLRFPLPFSGPAMQFASVPAVGTALHPHIALSTTPPDTTAVRPEAVADIPVNTVREYTAFTHNSAFGDKFALNVPELEGGATGRSHLLGRVLIQFGARSGNTVPVSVSTLVPGGLLAKPPDSPMAKMFPGRLSLGMLGHDERLRYKTCHYDMHGVAWADDPFEVSLGSIDLKTGRLLGNFLFRGFIIQDVLLALIKLEPRTPKSSWYMRGPAAFEKDANGQTVFKFAGTVKVPYPEGYGFPKPDLQSCFTVGPNSVLDPYIYMEAMDGIAPPPQGKSGSANGVVASNGQKFSYKYALPADPASQAASFEYINETTGGAFRMGSLVWVSFLNAARPCPAGECDAVSFTGVGMWSLDPERPHVATVQISTAPEYPYVSIIIDGGMVSNVNTKPAKAVMPFPEFLQV